MDDWDVTETPMQGYTYTNCTEAHDMKVHMKLNPPNPCGRARENISKISVNVGHIVILANS